MVLAEHRERLRKKLMSVRPESLFTDLKDEYSNLYSQLEKSVKHNESTTTLVVGMPGSGKSSLVNHTIDKIIEKYPKNTIGH